jgi:hypothetical protein
MWKVEDDWHVRQKDLKKQLLIVVIQRARSSVRDDGGRAS